MGGGDAACTGTCDQDGDGVPDTVDQCPDTPAGATVNQAGCAESQVTPVLEPDFPPLGLTWTPTGDPGRAGGLTWTYTGIQRGDKFHIYWILCDDPNQPCGLSLNGPIDAPSESWVLSAADSDLTGGKLVFTDTSQIVFADGSSMATSGRMTVTIVDGTGAAVPFATVTDLGVPARAAGYGAENPGHGLHRDRADRGPGSVVDGLDAVPRLLRRRTDRRRVERDGLAQRLVLRRLSRGGRRALSARRADRGAHAGVPGGR